MSTDRIQFQSADAVRTDRPVNHLEGSAPAEAHCGSDTGSPGRGGSSTLPLPRPAPKFENTYCSQCGASFGPGDSGFSHCDQHNGLTNSDEVSPTVGRVMAKFVTALDARRVREATNKPALHKIDAVASFKPGSIQADHFKLIQAILDNPPLTLEPLATTGDLEERARHARDLLIAVDAYVDALLDDTNACVSTHLDTRYLRGRLSDVANEVVGELENAVETAREDATEDLR